MRTLILVTLITMSVLGCATPIPYTPKQKCAMDDMTVIGIDHGTSSTVAYGSGSGTFSNSMTSPGQHYTSNSSAIARSSGEYVRCAPPTTPEEKSEIVAINNSLGPIIDYNSSIGAKRTVTAVGYVLWFFPGIGAKLYYDGQYDKAVKASGDLLRAPASAKPSPTTDVRP